MARPGGALRASLAELLWRGPARIPEDRTPVETRRPAASTPEAQAFLVEARRLAEVSVPTPRRLVSTADGNWILPDVSTLSGPELRTVAGNLETLVRNGVFEEWGFKGSRGGQTTTSVGTYRGWIAETYRA